MAALVELSELDRSIAVFRTLTTILLLIIYIVYKSNKKLLYGESNQRYNYFKWVLLSIIIAFIDALVFVFYDNNF